MAVDIVSRVVVQALSYDLVDLGAVKDELNLPDSDTRQDRFLARTIAQVSSAIAQWCNRTFAVETVEEIQHIRRDPYPYQVPGGVTRLQLSRYPLAQCPLIPTIAAVTAGETTLPLQDTSALAETMTAAAGLDPQAIVTGIDDAAVTLSLPTSAAIAAGTLIAFGLTVTQTIAPGTVQPLYAGVDYLVNPDIGQLLRLDANGIAIPWEAMPVTVRYSTGYDPVPDDLAQAAMRLIVARFWARGRDPYLRVIDQPELGRKEYWIGGLPGNDGIPADIAAVLESYRVPVTL